jgi:hypothetical protein
MYSAVDSKSKTGCLWYFGFISKAAISFLIYLTNAKVEALHRGFETEMLRSKIWCTYYDLGKIIWLIFPHLLNKNSFYLHKK